MNEQNNLTAGEPKLSRVNQRKLIQTLLKAEFGRFFGRLLQRRAQNMSGSITESELLEKIPHAYHGDIAELEQLRIQLVRNSWPIRNVAFPALLIVTLGCLLFLTEAVKILIILLPLCWISLIGRMLKEGVVPDYAHFNNKFLTRILPAIASRFGGLRYQPEQNIALTRFQSRLHFGFGRHLARTIRDTEQGYYFQGTYKGCDWELEQVKFYGSSSGRKPDVLFDGHMMILNLPNSFAGTTTLNLACPLANSARVHLEQSHFTDRFWVESTDQIAARAWLTPAMMERLYNVNNLCKGAMHASLSGSSLILLLPGIQFASAPDIDTPITECLKKMPVVNELEQLFLLLDTLLAQFPAGTNYHQTRD